MVIMRMTTATRRRTLRRNTTGRKYVVNAKNQERNSRREMFGLMFAGVVAGGAAVKEANAYDKYDSYIKPTGKGATSIGIEDMRKKNAGVQLIYEARDIDLPLKDRYVYSRDAEAGKEMTPDATVKRIGDARDRIDGEVRAAIQGQDWAKARNALRGRAGFLRFDLNYLVSLKDKASKKEAIELKKSALQKIEDLDYQLRLKNQEASNGKIEVALAELDKAIAFLK